MSSFNFPTQHDYYDEFRRQQQVASDRERGRATQYARTTNARTTNAGSSAPQGRYFDPDTECCPDNDCTRGDPICLPCMMVIWANYLVCQAGACLEDPCCPPTTQRALEPPRAQARPQDVQPTRQTPMAYPRRATPQAPPPAHVADF